METLAIASVVMSVASGVTGFIGSMQSAAAADVEAQQYAEERQIAHLQASQDEAKRRSELAGVLSAQAAARAGRGLSYTTGTSKAIANRTIDEAEADIAANKITFLTRARRASYGAASAANKKTSAQVAGVGSLLSGFGSAASSGAKLMK